MIKDNITKFIARGKVPVYKKVSLIEGNYRTVKKTRKYLICDNCGSEIFLDLPKHKRNGGTLVLSYVLTGSKSVEIAICDNCAKAVYNEFWNE